jgi:hypothetical protein
LTGDVFIAFFVRRFIKLNLAEPSTSLLKLQDQYSSITNNVDVCREKKKSQKEWFLEHVLYRQILRKLAAAFGPP